MNLSWRQLSRLLGIFALAFVGLVGALTLGGSVSAHYPVLESQTSRDCGDYAPWTATVTARSDQDWDKDWKSRHHVDAGAPSAWSPLTDDQVPYAFEVGPFDAAVTSANVTVESRWFLKSDGSLSAKASRSITIPRPDSSSCGDTTTTPAAPSVTYECDYGYGNGELVIIGADDTDSVDYTIAITQAPGGEGSNWAVTITATPQPGYQFPPDTTTEWNFTGTVNCDTTTVTPAAPSVTYDCAIDELVIIGADDTDTVDYTIDITTPPGGEGSNWAVTITATPQPGYQFPPDTTTEWNFTGTVDCLMKVTPAAPSVTYDCAIDELVIIGADDTDSVDYTIAITQAPGGEGSNWAVTITATPQPGYQFPPDTTTEWNFTGTVDCDTTTTPAAPSVTYDCAIDELVIIGADDTDSVDYTIDITTPPGGEGSNWAVTITATPQPGYQFPPDTTTEWNFTGTVDCDTTTTPAAPSVTYDCAIDELVIIGADDTDSVDYTIDITTPPGGEGSNWAVTITATPQPGYQFPPDTTTEWNFTGTVDCDTTTTPAAPSVTYDCAIDELVIIGADDTDSVDYTIDITTPPGGEGSNWAVTITATPQPGYQFPPDTTTEWNFTGTVDCLVYTTPEPPELACRLAPDKGLEVKLNSSETYSYEVTGNLDVNEDETYDVTVVAMPAAGYEFPPGTTAEWNFTGVVMCQRIKVTTTTTGPTTTTSTIPTTTTTSTTVPTTTTTKPPGTAVTGSSSTGLLLAYASIVTLLGGLLLLIKRTFRPERG